MEFWGVEVKSGESLSVSPEEGRLIHVSQVALGEVKNIKGAQYVPIRMKIDDNKYIIGSLSAESRPHLTFDLVFEKEFELSHDWKDGSVFFCGYTADNPDQEEFGHEDFSDEDEDVEEDLILENGKVVPDVQVANPTKSKDAAKKPVSATKLKVTLVDPKKEESHEEEDSDDSDEELNDDSDDSDLSGDSDDDMSEDEETPKKAEPSKKRPSESATKTPVPAKKAKSDTPQKTDGKKGSGHKATPHPSKQAVKKTVETPKSSGQVSCKSCSKTFNSEKGLESHSKAKHGGK